MEKIAYLDLAINSKQLKLDLLFAKFNCNFNFSEKYHTLHHSEFPVANSIVDLLINLASNLELRDAKILEKIKVIEKKLDEKAEKSRSKNLDFITDQLEELKIKLEKVNKQIKTLENIPLEIDFTLDKRVRKNLEQIVSPILNETTKLQQSYNNITKLLEKHKKLLLGDPEWNND